jgi:hypothetical protein
MERQAAHARLPERTVDQQSRVFAQCVVLAVGHDADDLKLLRLVRAAQDAQSLADGAGRREVTACKRLVHDPYGGGSLPVGRLKFPALHQRNSHRVEVAFQH